MIALAYDNTTFEADFRYSGGCLVSSGFDLETAVLMSLFNDARALPGDPLPRGANRRGFWADVYDPDGESLGSRLWLLEDEKATPETARRAEGYAHDALKWMIDDGHVLSISSEWEVKRDAVWLGLTFTLRDGESVTLSPFKVT